jgi:hypothetical protein
LVVTLLFPLLFGCDQQALTPSTSTPVTPTATSLAAGLIRPAFDPNNFVRVVDNRFFPLRPGTRFVFKGEEDGEAETNITVVTRDRKNILGISAVVVLDRVFVHGKLQEKTFDWYAQDKQGNVWYLGEDTKEFENGQVVSTAGSFEAGKHGAKAGIIMLAHPQVGDKYQQELAPGIAEDVARVVAKGLDVQVPYGSFHNCLRTVEFTALEPGVKEAKLYCPAVGFVRAASVEGPTTRLVLTRIVR